MTKRDNRLIQLLSILKSKNGAALKELSNILNVSEMTIRRDLEILSEKNLVKVVHGAAIFNQQSNISIDSKEYLLDTEKVYQSEEKRAIGQKAATLVEPNDVIIIDTGSTTQYLAKYLPDSAITVLCYNINILFELKDKQKMDLIVPGGYYHNNTQMFQSPEGIKLIERTCASKAFISAAGVSNKLGVSCIEQYEVQVKHAAIKSSIKKILITDSTKFDKVRPALFAKITDFDTVVTDSGISGEWVDYINSLGIKLIIA